MSKKKLNLKATPEEEDFRGKYESGKAGDILLDRYFDSLEKLTNLAFARKDGKLKAIELGCGEGLSTKRINEFLPKNVALEASEYVAHQIKDAKKNNPGMRITQESVYELTHNDNTFDIIFLPEVLEHLDYPDKALEELNRVLKENGYLIIGVPREPLWRALNMLRGKYWSDWGNTPGHLNHWSKRSLIKYLGNNFEGKIVKVNNPIPWTQILLKKT